MYNTYRFKDKDPVIDIARTCVQIHAAMNNISFAKAIKSVSKSSGVSEACIWAWFGGATRMPRFATVAAVVHATGRKVVVGDDEVHGSKPRFRVLKGGRAA
jgi:DNA-binding phage protein